MCSVISNDRPQNAFFSVHFLIQQGSIEDSLLAMQLLPRDMEVRKDTAPALLDLAI